MLCPVDSPASLSEFSSPEPCVYEYKRGFVPDDARQDILIKEMTWPQVSWHVDWFEVLSKPCRLLSNVLIMALSVMRDVRGRVRAWGPG